MSEDERAARDRFFAVVDELRLNLPDVSQAEVEADVAVVIAAVRAGHKHLNAVLKSQIDYEAVYVDGFGADEDLRVEIPS